MENMWKPMAGRPERGLPPSRSMNVPQIRLANYGRLKFDLLAKFGCLVFGVVLRLIWRVWGGFRPPGAVSTESRADSTFSRRCCALLR